MSAANSREGWAGEITRLRVSSGGSAASSGSTGCGARQLRPASVDRCRPL